MAPSRSRRSRGRWLAAFLLAAATTASSRGGTVDAPGQPEPGADAIAALVARLGDTDFQRRESAAAELAAIGPAAVDALLAAAELDGDLEVALRARWIVDAIPVDLPHDSAEVGKLLESYVRRPVLQRMRVMHRLLRVDDDAGIEALARIVRLERAPAAAAVAAALLAGEWQPGDRYWPRIAERASVGLGASVRPAAAFVRALVGFSRAADDTDRAAALDAAAVALGSIERSIDREPGVADDVDDLPRETGAAEALRLLGRTRVRMLVASGRRDEALAVVAGMFDGVWQGSGGRALATRTADLLAWATEAGLPQAVDHLRARRPDLETTEPLVAWAAAAAERERGDAARAAALADAGFALEERARPGRDGLERLQTAVALARWGCEEWAIRFYGSLLDDARVSPAEFALVAIYGAEYLHELERDDEAAAFLGRLFDAAPGRRGVNAEQVISETGRDPRAVKARMHFFASCAAAARGDAAGRRQLVEAALREYGKEIDALIALHRLPDSSPDQRGDAARRINEALRQIENEIQSLPEDANPCNEWAWLAANTGGDAEKATRYSRRSLVKSFDNSSYLDTLAHCRAAAGDVAGAVRWQSLACRREPHNRTIRRNLERFEAMAAGTPEGGR